MSGIIRETKARALKWPKNVRTYRKRPGARKPEQRVRVAWPSHCGSPARPSTHSEDRSRSRAKTSASLTRSMVPAESLPILRSRRTVGRDPNP